MASLPLQHPTLSLHLADDSLTPLITSSRSRAHLESLTSLANSALTSQAAAQRVGMGDLERIMIEYPAPAAAALVLQSYLHVPRCHGSINITTTTTAAAAITTSDISRTTRGEDDGDNNNNDSNSNNSNHSTNSNGGRRGHGHGHDKVNQNSEDTSLSRSRTDAGAAAGSGKGASGKASDKDNDAGEDLQVPRLIGVVVAGTPQEAGEAKKAAARLERVGREFQSQWSLSAN